MPTPRRNRTDGTDRSYLPMVIPMGPLQGRHTVTVTSETTSPSGQDVTITDTFSGDGRSIAQIEERMNEAYGLWYPYLGCEVCVDWGKGALRYTLNENFGKMFLVRG